MNGITEGEYPDTPNEIAVSSSFKNTASVDRVFRVSDGILADLGGTTNETLS